MTNGLPPSDRDAERALLGTMLRDNSTIPEIMLLSRPEECYVVAHQLIFQAIVEINSGHHGGIDVVTVAEWAIANGKLEEIGGVPYLPDLYDAAPTAQNFRQYAGIVRKCWMRRQAIHVCNETIAKANDMTETAEDVIDEAERNILAIGDVTTAADTVSLQEALTESYDRIDARVARNNSGESNGILTGLSDLDSILAGFQNGEMVVIAARPSVGKSALSLQCAAYAAIEQGIPTLFISLEQSRTELTERLLCSYANIDSYKMRRGYLDTTDMGKIADAGHLIGGAKMYFDDAPTQGMMRIAANCRRMKNRHGIGIVFIDYLQLIDTDNPKASRQEQVAAVSKRIKGLARELKIPVVAMAQFNRQADDGKNTRPRLSQLKESGAIEQDADTVIAIHRDRPDDGAPETTTLIVLKNRSGPIGDCDVVFDGRFMKFFNGAIDTMGQSMQQPQPATPEIYVAP